MPKKVKQFCATPTFQSGEIAPSARLQCPWLKCSVFKNCSDVRSGRCRPQVGPVLAFVGVVGLLCNTEVEADGNRHMKICIKNQYLYIYFIYTFEQ